MAYGFFSVARCYFLRSSCEFMCCLFKVKGEKYIFKKNAHVFFSADFLFIYLFGFLLGLDSVLIVVMYGIYNQHNTDSCFKLKCMQTILTERE